MRLLIKLLIAGGAVSSPAFTATLTALTNATGVVTTLAYINPGSGGGSFTPAFTMSRNTGKENLAVYFDASATASAFATNAEHECKFEWNFGDESGEFWLFGGSLLQSRNVAYGPQAAHVFKTPGTHPVQLKATDPMGNVGYSTQYVYVSAWTEAETIYIASGSTPLPGFNGVPADALSSNCYNETTWAGVISRKAANKRIRLSNASTWAASTSLTCENGMQVDGYGAGSKWNVTTGTWANGAVFDVKNRSDVRIVGGKHTGTGYGHGTLEANTVGGGAGATTGCINILMMDMESTASYGLWSASTGAKPDGIFAVNCKSYDIALNGIAGGAGAIPVYIEAASRLALLGNFFDNIQSSHCTRIAGGERVVIANNQFSRATLTTAHCLTIRGYTNHVDTEVFEGRYTEKVVICDNYLWSETSSGYLMHVAPQNDGYAERHRNVIIERNYFVSALTSTLQTQVISGTCTVRNNLFVVDSVSFCISVLASSDVNNGSPSDSRIYNNTGYKTSASSGFSFIDIGTETSFDPGYSAPTQITGLDIRNNLAYAPNDSSAKLMVIYGMTPSYRATPSNNSSDTQVRTVRPWAATTPTTYADFAPSPGSYAKDGGSTDVWVFEDFLRASITGTRDIGAIQA